MSDHHDDPTDQHHLSAGGRAPRIATRDDLEAALASLVRAAYEEGVVTDDSAFRLEYDGGDVPNWEVHLTRVTG